MVDRFLVWVSAGVITAGMSAAMVAGAGSAVADDASGTGGTATTESSKTEDSKADSTVGGVTNEDPDESPTDPVATDPDVNAEEPAEEPAEEAPVDAADDGAELDDVSVEKDDRASDRTRRMTTAPPRRKPTIESQSDRDAPVARESDRDAAVAREPDRDAAVAPEPQIEALVKNDEESVEPIEQAHHQRMLVVIDEPVAETPEVQAVAFASAPATAAVNATATAPQIPGIIRMIGTIVFDLYAVAIRLVGGPPILPANSTVTVRSSSLMLNCGCEDGDTIEVPADWYIPKAEEGKPPPDRLIYLQHGFLAAAPWYSHTAAALAEQTNSIVVAPSITSNFFAADACWLGAAPMHEAIAGLFAKDNTALKSSALAAGYSGPVPDRVVLMGHSLGGRAVSGAAGFMAGNGSIDRLAGVVLLDGVGLDDPDEMKEPLLKVPRKIPIYQLASPVYFWNNFGVGIDALVEARPDKFVGVTLVNGSHVDTMRGGNPLIQFSQQLVSGFSTPQNVAAAQMLMVGWVNDMFAGKQQTGIYLKPGEEFSFDTPAGEAAVVALPNTLTKPFFLNPLKPLVPLADFLFTFEPTCVAASMGTARGCEELIAA